MEERIRVRFAPSPTGPLHVGNARTALFNFLFARQKGGTFILRLEDTDVERSTAEAEKAILEDLLWLGLDWNEGPGKSGEYGPYRQSERQEIYRRYASKLLEKGQAYRCYCSAQELEEKRKRSLARGVPPKYDGRCRNLKPEEERLLAASGQSPSWRFRIEARSVEFEDLVKGRISFDARGIGDFIILRSNPDLMAERLSPPKGAKNWDRAILSILRLAQLARYILAGLDQRYGWTVGFPLAAQIAALAVCILSTALFVWSMANNTFFSAIVRIQSDRGHAVATAGPYRYVRHPGYVGMILFEFAISTLFASWPAIIAGGLCALLLVLRTALEDRTLQAELPGYADYAHQVRYRLIPGIW